jgi:hypothetical protein
MANIVFLVALYSTSKSELGVVLFAKSAQPPGNRAREFHAAASSCERWFSAPSITALVLPLTRESWHELN